MWSEVLKVPKVRRTDSFFDLGGDSMKGLELLLRIENVFGRRLPVHTLLVDATVEKMAEILRTPNSTDSCRILVPIRSEGSRQGVYWLPGGGGLSVMAFRNLSHRLGLDRPVYGLEADLDLERAPRTLPELAQNYMHAITQHQKHGPYHLFGFSLGSFVAYEIARQMRASGREVGLLVVFDTGVPSLMHKNERYHLLLRRLWRKASGFNQRQVLISNEVTPLQSDKISKNTVFDIICKRNIEAIYQYAGSALPPYDGKVLCVLARQSTLANLPGSVDPRLAWRRAVTGGIEAVEVFGDHLSMLERPFVEDVAAVLNRYLRAYDVKQKI